MLGLKSNKSAPKETHGRRAGWTPGCSALTPSEWREYVASRSGTYLVIGGRPNSPDHVTYPLSRWDAQRIFDAVIDECEFTAEPGYRVRIVARDR